MYRSACRAASSCSSWSRSLILTPLTPQRRPKQLPMPLHKLPGKRAKIAHSVVYCHAHILLYSSAQSSLTQKVSQTT